MKQSVFVSPAGEGWQVKVGGQDEPLHRTATQKEAIALGRTAAIERKTELVVQRRDGTIRSKDSFGPDPFPPGG